MATALDELRSSIEGGGGGGANTKIYNSKQNRNIKLDESGTIRNQNITIFFYIVLMTETLESCLSDAWYIRLV